MKTLNDIIGQEGTKRKLNFFLTNKGVVPHLMFVSEKGCGKTSIARVFANNLKNYAGFTKNIVEINCSTIKNIVKFTNEYLVPQIWGREVTIIFDEASEMPRDVTMALLTLLNPTPDHINTLRLGERTIKIDFSKQTFIFCTTEPQKVFHALMDRCERVDLEPYSIENLTNILQANISIGVEYDVLKKLATMSRGNPRAAIKMSENVNGFVRQNGLYKFGQEELEHFAFTLNILPLGLTRTELEILKILQDFSLVRLSHIAAKLGMTATSIQRYFENYLLRNKLISICNNGRSLTDNGREYLSELNEKATI